jgi:hypothetical protein
MSKTIWIIGPKAREIANALTTFISTSEVISQNERIGEICKTKTAHGYTPLVYADNFMTEEIRKLLEPNYIEVYIKQSGLEYDITPNIILNLEDMTVEQCARQIYWMYIHG